jgi:hypothetical protein
MVLQQQQVVVRRWDPAEEGFAALADEDEVCNFHLPLTVFVMLFVFIVGSCVKAAGGGAVVCRVIVGVSCNGSCVKSSSVR